MSIGNEELLVLSEIDNDSDNIFSTLVHPLEDIGYSVHITNPDNCVSAIEKYHPNIVLLPFSNIHESFDFSELLRCIHAKDNELAVIILAAESKTAPDLSDKKARPRIENDPLNDKVVHIKSAQIQALLEQGAEDVVFGSREDALTIAIVKRAIEQALEKKQQRQLLDDNNVLRLRLSILDADMVVATHTVAKMSPESPAQLGSFRMEYLSRPCLDVGGDSVNYFQLMDGRIAFYFADVSGHGAPAAIITAVLMSLKRYFIQACDANSLSNTSEMLSWYNDALLVQGFDQHITMFFGLLDESKSTFQYSNAAHFPSVILQSNSSVDYIELQGLPLAMCKTKYEFRELKLNETFNLVMFSDGVLEIMGQSSLVEKEETLLSLVECGNTEIGSLREVLGLDELEYTPDDIAIFTITREN